RLESPPPECRASPGNSNQTTVRKHSGAEPWLAVQREDRNCWTGEQTSPSDWLPPRLQREGFFPLEPLHRPLLPKLVYLRRYLDSSAAAAERIESNHPQSRTSTRVPQSHA